MFTRPKKTCSLVLVCSCGNSLLVTHDVAESILKESKSSNSHLLPFPRRMSTTSIGLPRSTNPPEKYQEMGPKAMKYVEDATEGTWP